MRPRRSRRLVPVLRLRFRSLIRRGGSPSCAGEAVDENWRTVFVQRVPSWCLIGFCRLDWRGATRQVSLALVPVWRLGFRSLIRRGGSPSCAGEAVDESWRTVFVHRVPSWCLIGSCRLDWRGATRQVSLALVPVWRLGFRSLIRRGGSPSCDRSRWLFPGFTVF